MKDGNSEGWIICLSGLSVIKEWKEEQCGKNALWKKKKGYLRFGTFVKENMFKVLVSPLEVPRARLDGAWGNLV